MIGRLDARVPATSVGREAEPRRSMRVAFRCAALVLAIGGLLCSSTGILAPAAAESQRRIEELTTPGGVRAWIVQENAIPLVAIRFAIMGGALHDPPGKEGLATLMAALMTEGAGKLDSSAFARRLADEGAQLSISGARDRVTGGLDVLASRLDAASDLLRQALASPRFDVDAFERVKSQRLADLEIAANEPRRIAFERWHAESFPGHRYGRPADGTSASVKAITRKDITDQFPRVVTKSTLSVVIVGAIDRESAIRLVDRTFAGLPTRAVAEDSRALLPRPIGKPIVVEKDLPLATVTFGAAALAKDHVDYPAAQVLNQIIGSGDFDATLMEEIRVKRGLAYAVSTSLSGDSVTSLMVGGMSTKNESMTEALAVLREVLARTATQGPTTDQFENAKSHLTGSWILDFDSNVKLADTLLRVVLDGRKADFLEQRNTAIERVTIEDVKRVARDLLAWERFNVVIVGRPTPAK